MSGRCSWLWGCGLPRLLHGFASLTGTLGQSTLREGPVGEGAGTCGK